MRNERHPIDDLFQRGLNQHAVPPPMHIWERIEESRPGRHRGKLLFVRHRAAILSGAAAIALLLVWLTGADRPALGSFPLMDQQLALAAPAEPEPSVVLKLPAREAGLVPELGNILRSKAPEGPTATPPVSAHRQTAGPGNTQIKGITGLTADEPSDLKPGSDAPPAVESTPPGIDRQQYVMTALERSATLALPTAAARLDFSPLPAPETGCARFSEGRPAIFFAVTAGPSLLNRTFGAKTAEYEGYAAERSSTESTQLSFGAEARLSVVFPWGGAIRSGIGYTQLNEQLTYRNSKVRQTTITEIYGPNGDVIGTDTSYITENTTLKYDNRHRLISIPFQLGYEVRYNKVTLAVNAGVNVNVAYAGKGHYLGTRELLPTRFDSEDPDLEPVYKTEVGLSWQASLGLHYQLNDHLDLMAEPYLRYYPESFTTANYPLNQNYLVGGVGVGLRVLL